MHAAGTLVCCSQIGDGGCFSQPTLGHHHSSQRRCRYDNGSGHIAILEEKVDEGYEPTDKEIKDYAEWLGMDAVKDKDLLWIACKGLKTPLQKPWQPCESASGDIFYFNPESGESKWDHPCDDELRALYSEEKAKRDPKGEGDAVHQPSRPTENQRTMADERTDSAVAAVKPDTECNSDVIQVEELESFSLEGTLDRQSRHSRHSDSASIEELKLDKRPKDVVEDILDMASFSQEDTPPASGDLLTGKVLPPPPAQAQELPSQTLTRRGSSDSLGSLGSLASFAALGPLPPLSLPLSRPVQSSSSAAVAASPSSGDSPKVGLEDVLGSPSDLLAGIGIGLGGRPSLGGSGSNSDSKGVEQLPPKPLEPLEPVDLPEKFASKPAALVDDAHTDVRGATSEPGAASTSAAHFPDSPLSPVMPQPPSVKLDEMQTPPSNAHVQRPADDASEEQSPVVQLGLDSLSSPPTPQLASILAAELRQEEQLSLWSQIEEEAGKDQIIVGEQPLPLGEECAGSLEISSLSAVLETSLVGFAGDALGRSMVEELQRFEDQADSAPTLPNFGTATHENPQKARQTKESFPLPVPLLQANADADADASETEEDLLREQLRGRARECESLRSQAQVAAGRAAAAISELEAELQQERASAARAGAKVNAESASQPRAPQQPSSWVDRGADLGEVGAEQLDPTVAAEMQSLMGSGGFRDTLKMCWDEASGRPTAVQHASTPSVDDFGPGDGEAALAAQRRVAQLEAELGALAARVKSVEAGHLQNQDVLKPQKGLAPVIDKDTIIPEEILVTKKLAATGKKDAERQAEAEDTSELQRIRWELRELQEEAANVERQLKDSRHGLGLEQATHSSTKAALRESHREVQRLRTQLKFKEGEAERLSSDLARSQADVGERELEQQHLQMKLQAREAELSQLRLSRVAQHRRLELCERSRILREKELSLEDRGHHLDEAEVRLGKKQRQIKVEGGSRRRLASPAAAAAAAAAVAASAAGQAGQAYASGRPHSARAMQGSSSAAKEAARIAAAAVAGPFSDDSVTAHSSSQSPVQDGFGSAADRICGEAKNPFLMNQLSCTPSVGSTSTTSLREVRCLGELSAEDFAEDLVATLGRTSTPAMTGVHRCSSSTRLNQDMAEAMRLRRQELRREHTELEEDRKQWRNEAQRLRKARAASEGREGPQYVQQSENLARTRTALDARAAALNKAIGEYRGMQRLVSSQQPKTGQPNQPHQPHRWASSTLPVNLEPLTKAAAEEAPLTARTSRSTPALRSSSNSGLVTENHLFKRWQHMLGPLQKDTATAIGAGTTSHSSPVVGSLEEAPSKGTSYFSQRTASRLFPS
ncbi:unnamed protein product [Polarella glacialis]|uniref:WW domain-containing protein n=1 Tax=Polarella glacialis TaxID=89957 RepID=A0A813KU81_POLGL|nr:unnamed protein product [Polarella glacialis]